MADPETRVRRFHKTIVRCIRVPGLVPHLVPTILSQDDGTRLTRMHPNDPVAASQALVDQVLASSVPGKWTAFIQALRSAEYPHLANLVGNVSYESSNEYYEHESKMIALFAPELGQTINAREMSVQLGDVLSDTDREEIYAACDTRGNHYANIVLLDCLQCRHAPRKWYGAFLNALVNTGRENIVKNMEPEYPKNPSGFMGTDLGPIYAGSGGATSGCDGNGQDAYGSVGVNVIMDVVEQNDLSMDDEAPPPPLPPPRHDSLNQLEEAASGSMTSEDIYQPDLDSEYHSPEDEEKLSNVSNFNSELNVKPEMTKLPLMPGDDADGVQRASKRKLRSMSPVDEDGRDPQSNDRDTEDNALLSDDDGPPRLKLNLHQYQLELAENAVLGRNTIICSGTGTGKTWVALHVVKKHLQQPSNGPRKVAFMARTGVLIKQQSDRFKKYLLGFQTKLFSGEEDDTKMINAFLPQCDILCFTPQILLNNLKSGGIASLSEFSLLILDECHHTRGDEPYSNLLRHYLVEKRNGNLALPQIIGLTASVGVGKAKTDEDAVEHLLHVCSLLDVRVLSTVERNKKEYLEHTQEPEEQVISMEKPAKDPIKDILKAIINGTEGKLEETCLLLPDFIELFFEKCPTDKESQEYNKWTVDIIKKAQMSSSIDDDTTRDIIMCAKYLNHYNAALEVNSLLRGTDVGKFLADRSQQELLNRDRLTKLEEELLKELMGVMKDIRKVTRDAENPNVVKLTKILQDELEKKGEDSRAIVFVEARATCKALARVLAEKLDHVKVQPLYGKDNRGFEEGMTQAVQDDTVEKFKSGLYKVLVSTSVGTEGLDIPACNIVLSYNYTGNEITKTQMKGRIRKEGGINVIMGKKKIVDKELINTYKVAMMYRAMSRVKQMDAKEMERKIAYLQEKELGTYRTKQAIDKYKKSKQSHDDDFEIRCSRCNTFACYTSDVRMCKQQYIVMDKAFADKIITKPHKSPVKFDGFHKKFKMRCKQCPMEWGIVSINQGLPCRTLKLDFFRLKSVNKGDTHIYKKWYDVPYAVPEIEAEDLPKLLGDEVAVQDE